MVDKHMLVSKTKKLNSRCKILKDFENKYNAQENRKKYSYNRKQQQQKSKNTNSQNIEKKHKSSLPSIFSRSFNESCEY